MLWLSAPSRSYLANTCSSRSLNVVFLVEKNPTKKKRGVKKRQKMAFLLFSPRYQIKSPRDLGMGIGTKLLLVLLNLCKWFQGQQWLHTGVWSIQTCHFFSKMRCLKWINISFSFDLVKILKNLSKFSIEIYHCEYSEY